MNHVIMANHMIEIWPIKRGGLQEWPCKRAIRFSSAKKFFHDTKIRLFLFLNMKISKKKFQILPKFIIENCRVRLFIFNIFQIN